jgi:hypothetical protein
MVVRCRRTAPAPDRMVIGRSDDTYGCLGALHDSVRQLWPHKVHYQPAASLRPRLTRRYLLSARA